MIGHNVFLEFMKKVEKRDGSTEEWYDVKEVYADDEVEAVILSLAKILEMSNMGYVLTRVKHTIVKEY